MKRALLAAVLATTGFVVVTAIAQTAPAPRGDPNRIETRDEVLMRADQRFDRMDANKDGKLTAEEMRPAPPPPPVNGAAPPPPPSAAGAPGIAGPRMGERMFARLDANGDGFVDRAEARALAERRFDRIDANKDGKIDPSEREAARDAMGDGMGQMRGMRRPGSGGKMPPSPPPAPTPNAGQ